MEFWFPTLFALLLGFLSTLLLARRGAEISMGIIATALIGLLVFFVSIAFLSLMGFFIVLVAMIRKQGGARKRWWNRSKDKEPSPVSGYGVLFEAAREGFREGSDTKEISLFSRKKETDPAEMRIFHAYNTNPFRPDGPDGLKPSIKDKD